MAPIEQLYRDCLEKTKAHRGTHNVALSETPVDELFTPVREAYEHLTGEHDIHQDEIVKHRLSLLGEPCSNCGKPLRTPQAKHCAACGTKKQN